MFSIQRPGKNCARIIRPTSGYELTAEEKHKLDSVEENAQENIIEVIKINDEALPVNSKTKTVHILLGDLALKDAITKDDLPDDINWIEHIKDGVDNGIEQKADAGYSYVDTGNHIVNSDVENDIVNDRGDKMPSVKVEVLDEESGQHKTVNRPLLGARGAFASAFGGNSLAVGKRAHAEGSSTVAFGSYSHSEGNGTYSKGVNSHAEGGSTTASGAASHAEGSHTHAEGQESHAEGSWTIAKGTYSHAEGHKAEATGEAAHAEGINTKAGDRAHAEGFHTEASGRCSHAEGVDTVASNYASHAEGNNTNAAGVSSHAEGSNTFAGGYKQNASGQYLNADGNIVSAPEVRTGDNAHAEGNETFAIGNASHAEGYLTKALESCTHAEGAETIAAGLNSHAEGYKAVANGEAAHVEGVESHAEGYCSHAEGYLTKANSDYSHTEGFGTVTSGKFQHVQGKYNIPDETSAFVVGNGVAEDELDEQGNITKQNRSNAMTVDWDGNAWFKGGVYVGGNNLSEGNKLATEDFVDDYVQKQKGVADGIAALDSTGKIISSQLPSYVDDVVEVHIFNTDVYRVSDGATQGREKLGSNNIFSIVKSKNIISNFDPSIGEDLEELHIAHGKATSSLFSTGISGTTGYYTISAEFEDDESYIEVVDYAQSSAVIAMISRSKPSATFYSEFACAGSAAIFFRNSLGNTLSIKKLQVSIGEEVLDYQKYKKEYVYTNPVTGEELTAELVTPEFGKIYVDILNGANKSYRWSGSALVEISKSLALGTSSASAYRGDYGNKAYQHSIKTYGNPHKVTKSDVRLGNVTNDAQVKRSEMGVANGVATLDSGGRIPSAQLPSYVDDVLEGVIYYNRFYKITSPASFNTDKVSAYGKNKFDCFKMAECYNMPYPNLDVSSYIDVGTIDIDLNNATHRGDGVYISTYTYTLSADVVQGSITVRNRGSIVGVLDTSTRSLTFTSSLTANETMLICTDAVFAGIQLEIGEAATIYEEFVGAYEGTPSSNASGKIYLNLNDLNTYRWSGSQFVEISSSLALGETESTAYAGNKGAQNASDIITLQNQVKDLTDKLQQLTTFVNALEIVATDDGTGIITFSLASTVSVEEVTENE